MSIPKWSLGFLSFTEETRLREERARRREEERMAEGRKQALLRRKLLILQIRLASPWAIEQMTKAAYLGAGDRGANCGIPVPLAVTYSLSRQRWRSPFRP
jgi:hypothetical protein